MNFKEIVHEQVFIVTIIFCYVQGLRDCCRSIRIGKILVESDADTHEARVVYARFPEDISKRKVLLMYPIMSEYVVMLKVKSEQFVYVHFIYLVI
jgi:uracil phosphoribosyltransferase